MKFIAGEGVLLCHHAKLTSTISWTRIWFSNITFCYISDLSNRVLTTLFQIGNVRAVSSIVHSARKALLKDFVPKHMGADHITRDDVIVSVFPYITLIGKMSLSVKQSSNIRKVTNFIEKNAWRLVYTEHASCSKTWTSYYILIIDPESTLVCQTGKQKWHQIQSIGLFMV